MENKFKPIKDYDLSKDNLCPERLSIGSGVNGGFTRYVIVPEKNIFYLPQNISYAAGALTEPLACCVHAVLEVAHVSVEERVLIIGPVVPSVCFVHS